MFFQESSDSDSSEYDDDIKDPDYIEEEVESDDTSDDDENNLEKQELLHSSIKGTMTMRTKSKMLHAFLRC